MQEEAFYSLIEKVVERIEAKKNTRSKWIDGDEAMKYLRIKSKSTLQKLRDEGKIKFSQPQKKIILYDIDSLDTYLERNARLNYWEMNDELKLDLEYKKSFNHGYQLAKELGLTKNSFKTSNSGNKKMKAITDGMNQYTKEVGFNVEQKTRKTTEKSKSNKKGGGISF